MNPAGYPADPESLSLMPPQVIISFPVQMSEFAYPPTGDLAMTRHVRVTGSNAAPSRRACESLPPPKTIISRPVQTAPCHHRFRIGARGNGSMYPERVTDTPSEWAVPSGARYESPPPHRSN